MNQFLYDAIKKYEPKCEQEIQDKKVMLRYIESFEDILTRENEFAHMTASPWIVNQDFTKVLLIYHKIYDSWGWCGGHCDGEEDGLKVALKEGQEEAGITSIRPLVDEIIALDILPSIAHRKRGKFVNTHVHLNLAYLCVADEEEMLHYNKEETEGAMWVPLEEVCDKVNDCDREMIPVYQKLNQRVKEYQARHLQL